MTQQMYRKLIDEVCAIEGIPDPSDLYDMAALRADDVSFVMMPVVQVGETWAIFFIDYGEPPADQRHLALQRLLEANAMAPDPFLPKFGIDIQTGRILLTGYFQVGAVNAESLIELLKHHAAQALEWRETRFMTEDDEDDTPAERSNPVDEPAVARRPGVRAVSSHRA